MTAQDVVVILLGVAALCCIVELNLWYWALSAEERKDEDVWP